jgi:hypothetical protein
MSDAVVLVWTATILAYAVIAVAFILGRWAINRIRQVLEHEGALQMAKRQKFCMPLITPQTLRGGRDG